MYKNLFDVYRLFILISIYNNCDLMKYAVLFTKSNVGRTRGKNTPFRRPGRSCGSACNSVEGAGLHHFPYKQIWLNHQNLYVYNIKL